MPTAADPEKSAVSQSQQSVKGKEKGKQKGPNLLNGKDEKKAALAQLPWTPIVQGQVNRLPIVFTRDAEYFFVAVLTSVKIYSRSTGHLVSTLSSAASTSSQKSWSNRLITESHSGRITGLCLNPANFLQLLTCSLDGTIKVWDYLDAVLVRTIDVGFPISQMVAHSTCQGSVYVALKKPKSNGSADAAPVDPFDFKGRCNSIIQLVSLNTISGKGANAMRSQSVTRVGKARQTTHMALTADGKHLVLIGKRKIHVAHTAALKEGFSKIISDQELTCLAMHPENNTFATGDSVGQIRLWYFLENEKKLPKAAKGLQVAPNVLLHWHAHAVSALTFTLNGANLLSGGEESVMVLWQLANQSKEFVPRLGGAKIESICVSPNVQGKEEEYVASLADGSIIFIGTINLKVVQTISQVLVDSSRQMLGERYYPDNISFPLVVHPRTGHLVVNAGHPSSLQFYDMETEKVASQIEIVASNRVSRPDEIPLDPSRVEKVIFSSKGEFMATVDMQGKYRGPCLKIWTWDTKQQIYKLQSRIDDPHNGSNITSITFSSRQIAINTASPPSLLLVTTGSDNKARTWRQISQQIKGDKKEEFWVARSVFDYRDMAIAKACWEPKSSLLALSHDDYVTIWEPISNTLQQVISIKGKSRGITFAGKGGRYIIVLSERSLMAWDIVYGQISWEVDITADHLVKYSDDHFCTLTSKESKTIVSIFTPSTSTLIKQYELKVSIRQICEIQLDTLADPGFYAITKEFDVIQVGGSIAAGIISPGHSAQSIRDKAVKRRTLFDELLGPTGMPLQVEEEQKDPIKRSIMQRKPLLSDGGNGLLDVASHLLPPMSVLYEPLMEQIIPKKAETRKSVIDTQNSDNLHLADEGEESGEEVGKQSNRKGGSIERLRQVSRMDMSSISALFTKQAMIVANPERASATNPSKAVINGKAAKTTNTTTSQDSILSKASSKGSSSNGKVNGVKANGHVKPIIEVVIETPPKSTSKSKKSTFIAPTPSPATTKGDRGDSSIDETPQRHSTRSRKRKEIIDYE